MMLRQVFVRCGPLYRAATIRGFASTPISRAIDTKQSSGPQRDLSEGHTTHKSHGLDVQNQAAKSAAKEKKSAGGSGEGEPFDTARQGGVGGESKAGEGEGTGSLKDHRGGQPGGAGHMGGKEPAAGSGGVLGGKRSLSTSAFASKDPLSKPKAPKGAEDKKLHGDQNAHLKHKDAKAGDKGKGNAAEDPHLPSKTGGKGGAKGAKHFSTSAIAWKDDAPRVKAHDAPEKAAGFNTPSEALPPHLDSAYDKTQTQLPKGELKSKVEVGYSSTAQDPPNEALRKAAKEGSLPDKNPQPHGGIGKKGNKDAWKDRRI